MTDEIMNLIQAFLSERRQSDGGGWAPVTRQDMVQLRDILWLLIEAKWAEDADGDRPVEYSLIDRTKYIGNNFFPIRYMFDATKPELMNIMRDCMTNVLMAQDKLDIVIKLLLYASKDTN